jgi:hypothetical protein
MVSSLMLSYVRLKTLAWYNVEKEPEPDLLLNDYL